MKYYTMVAVESFIYNNDRMLTWTEGREYFVEDDGNCLFTTSDHGIEIEFRGAHRVTMLMILKKVKEWS